MGQVEQIEEERRARRGASGRGDRAGSWCQGADAPLCFREPALGALAEMPPASQALSIPTPESEPRRRRTFVALDFETADRWRDSACAIALVRVEDGAITARVTRLIRPPRRGFTFSYLHGIRWMDVRFEPHFGELWPRLAPLLDGAEFLAAHNAPFDRSVLNACCEVYGLHPPALGYLDTVQLARKTWNLRPAKLPDVCAHLKIPLQHHDASSDAEACARIVLAAGADLA